MDGQLRYFSVKKRLSRASKVEENFEKFADGLNHDFWISLCDFRIKLGKVVLLQIFVVLAESVKLDDFQKCSGVLRIFKYFWHKIEEDPSTLVDQIKRMIERSNEIIGLDERTGIFHRRSQNAQSILDELECIRKHVEQLQQNNLTTKTCSAPIEKLS